MKTKLKLILPLFAVAQIFSASKFPPRTPSQILLASCAKGVEVCKNCNLGVNYNEANVSQIVGAIANSTDMFQASNNINSNVLRNLSQNESDILIIGFIMLLMDSKATGISLNEAIAAAKEFASMPSSPQYFKNFVNNNFALLQSKTQAFDVVETLTNGIDNLDSNLVAKLEAAGNHPKYKTDDNGKMNAVRALLRNNKK